MPESTPAPRSWQLWAIAVAGGAVLTGALILSLASARLSQPALRAFFVGWIVVPYVLSGLIAWWRRPASRLGPLMLLLGFTMALTPLQWSTLPLLHSLGHVLDMVPAALFLHVFLAYPSGRLSRRPERWLVAACYVITLGLQLVKIGLGSNPDNVLRVVDQLALANVVERVQLGLVVLCLLTGAVALFRRRQPAAGPMRRPSALVVDAFGFALIMLAVLYIGEIFSWPFTEPVRLIAFAALGLAPVAFLVGLLNLRLARGNVAELVIELGADPTIDLQAPLARALRDPTLELSYWLPEFGAWVDQAGRVTAQPAADGRRGVRILRRENQPMAAVSFDRSLEEESELLDAVLATADIALENGRLRAELRARLEELNSSRARVLEASRQERQRLERDLHDGAQVRLVALSLELGLLGQDPATDPALRSRLRDAKATVAASLEELRSVARGIYPAVLSGHGLPVALESLAARASIPVQLKVMLEDRLPEAIEVAAYYVTSEALANVAKHADADSADVEVRRDGPNVVVEVRDDGTGGAAVERGSGLRGLADRVEALGGRMTVDSAPGRGTRVHADIPCP